MAMAKKKKVPTNEQKAALKANGLPDYIWEVTRDLPNSLIVRHRITGEFKVIEKKGAAV